MMRRCQVIVLLPLLLLLLGQLSTAAAARRTRSTESVGDCDSCGGVLRSALRGTIRFNGTEGTTNCAWTLPARPLHRLVLTFEDFPGLTCHNRYGFQPTGSVHIYLKEPGKQAVSNASFSSHSKTSGPLYTATGKETTIDLHTYPTPSYCASNRPSLQLTYSYERLPWSLSELPSSKTEGEEEDSYCLNGGEGSKESVQCACPPGFGGLTCEQACGWGRYGDACEHTCPGDHGCRGRLFCGDSGCREKAYCADECSCASGLQGPRCNQVCGVGAYGANCTQGCGQCEGGAACDPFTGHCPGECQPGFLPPFCQHELKHFREAPVITRINDTYVTGYIPMRDSDLAGRGTVNTYLVQYKVVGGAGGWVAAGVGSSRNRLSDERLYFQADGLPADTELDVRVLLQDERLRAYDRGVPSTRVRTTGRRRVENLKTTSVAAREVHLAWDSYDFKRGEYFYVKYECLSLLACSSPCPDRGGVVAAVGLSAVLERLLPGARYRATVLAAEKHEQSVVFTTPAGPNVEAPTKDLFADLFALRVAARTNNSALLEWGPTDDACPWVFGTSTSFRWSLTPAAGTPQPSDYTRTDSRRAMLTGLEPMTNYTFNLIARAADMGMRPVSLQFLTEHTVPDPPRDLTVYRQNRTALWLRWRPPARPSGKLRFYLVRVASVQGDSSAAAATSSPLERTDRLDADASPCVAWPDHVCHVVGRLKPRARYALTVTAVNEHGDLPGEEANVLTFLDRGVSEPPQALRLVSAGARSATVSWSLPSLLHADLTYFEVAVTRLVRSDEESADADVEDPDPQRYPVSEERPSYAYRVSGLQPGASYTVTVSCGYRGLPARLEVTTATKQDEEDDDHDDDDLDHEEDGGGGRLSSGWHGDDSGESSSSPKRNTVLPPYFLVGGGGGAVVEQSIKAKNKASASI